MISHYSVLAALMLQVLAGVTLIYSEWSYLFSIIRKECSPNPVTWATWTLGAWMLAYVEFAGLGASSAIRLTYFIVIAASTSAIFLSSALVGGGARYLGKTEAVCFTIAAISAVLWNFYDAPWVVFWAALSIDMSGAWPMIRSVRSNPEREVLAPWVLTVVSAACNLMSVLLLFYASEGSWTSLLFGSYYLLANWIITAPIFRHYRRPT